MKNKLESRLPGEISTTSDMQMTLSIWQNKEPVDEGERGEFHSGLKLNIQKTKTMASSPIISWQINRETTETVTDFIFLDSKITADGDCSNEIKRRFSLEEKQ